LWVLVAASVLAGMTGSKPFTDPARRAATVFVGVFMATQLFIFGFTDQGIWADTYTAINRLPLHFMPALLFAALTLFRSRAGLARQAEAHSVSAGGARPPLSPALLAGLAAAVIAVAGALVFLARDLPREPVEALDYAAADFRFMMGSGSAEGDRMVIDGFTDGYALLSSGEVAVPAADYRFLRLDLAAISGDGVPVLFWRRSDAPGELVRLPLRSPGSLLIDLSAEEGWRGEISEFGLLFEEGGGSFAVGPAALEPDSLALRLRLTRDSWTVFERWTQKSVNFLQGGSPQQSLRLPTLLTAWLAVTLALLWLLSKRAGANPRLSWLGAALAFLAAWMLLDVRWTVNSLRQAGNTLASDRGLSEDVLLARGLDGPVYRYVSRLEADVLPATPARILIIGDRHTVEYYLQRARYHLLPHSAYATRRIPTDLEPASLDYVIFLGPADAMRDVPGWSAAWERASRPVDRAELGTTFAIVRAAD
jgi:hypothetical protein